MRLGLGLLDELAGLSAFESPRTRTPVSLLNIPYMLWLLQLRAGD
jgi:hypothetical protein